MQYRASILIFAFFVFALSGQLFSLSIVHSNASDFFPFAIFNNISVYADDGNSTNFFNKYSYAGQVGFSNINSSSNFSASDGSLRLQPLGIRPSRWSATTSMGSSRNALATIFWKGRVYAIGGYTAGTVPLASVEGAQVLENGSIGSWRSESPMAVNRSYFPAVVANGRIYVFGGYDTNSGQYLSHVESVAIQSNGSLGSWRNETSLQFNLSGSGAALFRNRVYLISGESSAGYVPSVVSIPILSNGSLGGWRNETFLSQAKAYFGLSVWNGRIYTFGGYDSSYAVMRKVESVEILANGSLGGWRNETFLPSNLAYPTCVVHNGVFYVLGGSPGSGSVGLVQSSSVLSNGTLSSWRNETGIAPRYDLASILYNDRIYLFGGGTYSSSGTSPQVIVSNLLASNPSALLWRNESFISTPRYGLGAVLWNNTVYSVGGYSGSASLNKVESATVLSNGSLGSWRNETSLALGRSFSGVVVYNGRIFVVSGRLVSVMNTVVFGEILANGSINGSWITETVPMVARDALAAVAWNGRIYAIGGANSGGTILNITESAAILANGSLVDWRNETPLQVSRKNFAAVVYNGRVYVIGGIGGTNAGLSVESAEILANGSIQAWRSEVSLPETSQAISAAVLNGKIYVIGGLVGGVTSSKVYGAEIGEGGVLGNWQPENSMAAVRQFLAVAASNKSIFAIGGNPSGSTTSRVVESVIVAANGTVSNWVNGTQLLAKRHDFASIVWNGRVYLLGGSNGSILNGVQSAAIISNGSIGGWRDEPLMGMARKSLTAISWNSRIYAFGGFDGQYLNSTESAEILANGSLGSWRNETLLPLSLAFASSVVWNGRVYLLGGYSPGLGDTNLAFSASLLSNGSIGSWRSESPLASNRSSFSSVVWNGRVYSAGGFGNGTYLNGVESAAILSNGSLGGWISETPMIFSRANHSVVVFDGILFALNGFNGSFLSTVESAPILHSGRLDTWRNETSTSFAKMSSGSVAWNGRLHSFGGLSDGGVLNETESGLAVQISSAGNYTSSVVDLNGSYTVNSIGWSAALNNGSLLMSYRLSDNGTDFTSWASFVPSNNSANSLSVAANASYVQYAFIFNYSIGPAFTEWSPEVYDVSISYGQVSDYLTHSNLSTYPTSPANYSASQFYQFNATWNASPSISAVLFEWNYSNGTVVNYSALSLGSNVYSWNFTGLAAGNYSYRWFANNSLGSTNSTEVFNYTVNVASPSPAPSSSSGGSSSTPTPPTCVRDGVCNAACSAGEDVDCQASTSSAPAAREEEVKPTPEPKVDEKPVDEPAAEKVVEAPKEEPEAVEKGPVESKTVVELVIEVLRRGSDTLVIGVTNLDGTPAAFVELRVNVGGKEFLLRTDENGRAVLQSSIVATANQIDFTLPSGKVVVKELPGQKCELKLWFFVLPCLDLWWLLLILAIIAAFLIFKKVFMNRKGKARG